MTTPQEPQPSIGNDTPILPTTGRKVLSVSIPDLKTPSGTIWNDLLVLATALVALLKALGVIG